MARRFTLVLAFIFLFLAGASCSFKSAPSGWQVTLELDPNVPDRAAAVRQTIGVIERRLDLFAVSGSKVTPVEDSSSTKILVSLPNVTDRERIKRIITSAGRFEAAAVVSPPSPAPYQTYGTREAALASSHNANAANQRVLRLVGSPEPSDTKWVIVESPSIIDGSDLRSIVVVPERSSGQPSAYYQINFSLTKQGSAKISGWTSSHINQYIATIVDDEVKSVAHLMFPVLEQGAISGHFSKEKAEELAHILSSGSLAGTVKIAEESSR
jgi:preprotein translocase subunit SecD